MQIRNRCNLRLRYNVRLLRKDESPKAAIKEEKKPYSEIKSVRWILLAVENSLSDDKNLLSEERYFKTMPVFRSVMR